jgi:hypothetical protein
MTDTPNAHTTEELLILMGRHVRAIRGSVAFLAFVALIQLVVLALWIFGVVVVEVNQ